MIGSEVRWMWLALPPTAILIVMSNSKTVFSCFDNVSRYTTIHC